ncbi:MAG: glycoside hydrolase family 11 protein [Defluviitaleaceae bacterium]|nr:glycoside hydrolase family 11 protein [Defluviitaleaceae bacterium]
MGILTRKIIIFIFATIFSFLMTYTIIAEENPMTFNGERNARGNFEGFDYEFWIQNRGEDAEMALTGGGTFDCRWGDDVFNVLFRTGRKLGSTMTYHEYGEITIEYTAEHNITRGNVSYLCVYGWTENPLVEFYIIESRGSYKPPRTRSIGLIDIDDGKYEIFESLRVDQPSIHGSKTTFPQYWSVRVGNRTEGTISVSEHFRAWEEAGLDMSGTLFEIAMCIEGFESSGSGRLTRHILTIGDEVYGADIDTSGTRSFFAPDEIDEPEEIIEPDDEPDEQNEPDEIIEPEESEERVINNTSENDNNGFPITAIIVAIAAIAVGITAFFMRRKR